jgi:hypothetical protein
VELRWEEYHFKSTDCVIDRERDGHNHPPEEALVISHALVLSWIEIFGFLLFHHTNSNVNHGKK